MPLFPGCKAGSSGGRESTFSWEIPREVDSSRGPVGREGRVQLLSFQGLQATCCCCCFSQKADKKLQSFLPSPHSRVYTATGTGLYRSGCSAANPRLFGLQPLYSPTSCGRTSIVQANLLFILLSNSPFPVHCADPSLCATCSSSPIVLPPAGLSHDPLAWALSWSSR